MFLSTTFLCQAAIEEGDYAVFSVAFLLMSVSKEPLTTFNHSKVIEGLCISSLLHSGKNKNSPLPIRNTSTNGGFSIAMLDYQSSGYIIHKRQWHEHVMAITRGIWTQEPLCRNSEFPWSQWSSRSHYDIMDIHRFSKKKWNCNHSVVSCKSPKQHRQHLPLSTIFFRLVVKRSQSQNKKTSPHPAGPGSTQAKPLSEGLWNKPGARPFSKPQGCFEKFPKS